jgi:molybdopterin-synthase adenylyltransferase
MPALETIDKMIARCSKSGASFGKNKCRVIEHKNVLWISSRKKIPVRAVEILCLKQKAVPLRYLRNIGTVGIDGQLKLLSSSVAICGAGGLGGTVIELLARAGVGHLIIIDNDKFSESNLNRQIMAVEEDLGKFKVKVAAARVKKINTAVMVTVFAQKIDSKNVKKMIKNAHVVIDGLDNSRGRIIVSHACGELKIPFIHGAVAGWCGQLLSLFPEDNGFKSFCASMNSKSSRGIEELVGTPSATPAVIAAWQAQEAVKIITGIGNPIRERILFLDFSAGDIGEIKL